MCLYAGRYWGSAFVLAVIYPATLSCLFSNSVMTAMRRCFCEPESVPLPLPTTMEVKSMKNQNSKGIVMSAPKRVEPGLRVNKRFLETARYIFTIQDCTFYGHHLQTLNMVRVSLLVNDGSATARDTARVIAMVPGLDVRTGVLDIAEEIVAHREKGLRLCQR